MFRAGSVAKRLVLCSIAPFRFRVTVEFFVLLFSTIGF